MTVRFWAEIFWLAMIRFDQNDGWSRSSHITLSLMLALFPFAVFAMSFAQAISQDLSIVDLVEFIYGTWPDDIAQPIVDEVQAVLRDSDVKAMTIAGLLAVFFASNGVDAVRQSLTAAYRDHDPRPLWKSRALCVLFVFCGAALLSLSAGLVFVIPMLFDTVSFNFGWRPEIGAILSATRRFFPFVLLLCAVIACHLWLPGQRHALKQVLPGVVVTTILWLAVGKGFEIYAAAFSSYSITYAGLAGVMAALVFLYIMAVIFLFGAEFNGRLIASRTKQRTNAV